MEEIAEPLEEDGDWAQMLSEREPPDDEMYYCGYWGLYCYAFNDTLKAIYQTPLTTGKLKTGKEGLWNIMTAMVTDDNVDLKEAIWHLQRYPLDLVTWTVKTATGKILSLYLKNFRTQTITEVCRQMNCPSPATMQTGSDLTEVEMEHRNTAQATSGCCPTGLAAIWM